MVGIWAPQAQTYLWVVLSVTTLLFALPIFLVPLKWAEVMRFRIPRDTDLAVYFGRCLGAFILIVEWLMFRSAQSGAHLQVTFDVLCAVAVLMLVVHIYGAIRGIQPITETLEIGLWMLLLMLTLAFYPLG